MKLTVPQVAEKLGISDSVVTRLTKDGALIDTNPRQEGAKKHHAKYDSKQVSEFC